MDYMIDITEEYNDLMELNSILDKFDNIPQLLSEDANVDITKIFIEFRKQYTEEAKECKRCIKEKKYNEAAKHARNMKPIVANMKTEISKINSAPSESVMGTCLAVVISAVQVTIPVLTIVLGATISKTVAGKIAVTGISINNAISGDNSNEFAGIVNAIKGLSQDMKAYKKSDLGLEPLNGYKVKMISYCNRLMADIEILQKKIKAMKIMDS